MRWRFCGEASRLSGLLLLFLYLSPLIYAKDGIPKVDTMTWLAMPFDVKYFDDTEIVLAQTTLGALSRSEKGGVEWERVPDIEGFVRSFWMHPYNNDWAYAIGTKEKHWFTKDKGKSWKSFELPDGHVPARTRIPFAFNAFNPEKIIIKAQEDKQFGYREMSYYTKNGFGKIELLKEDTRECLWIQGTPQLKPSNDDKAYDDRTLCIVQGDHSGMVEENRILISDTYFKASETPKEPVMQDGRKIRGFVNVANVKGYMIAAAKAEGSTELALMVSGDGETWHQGVFPHQHKIHEKAYTILESNNYSIQVDVLTTGPGSSIGVLFSSNSNGTYFTEDIEHTNRNAYGIVDFEQIQGMQGIIMVNVVRNWEEVEANSLIRKQVQSKISFDDGKTWKEMKDKDGRRIHLHSVTDMSNSGKVFSSPAAGLIMGIGNQGNFPADYLQNYNDGDLWVSDDAGLTWTKGLEGAHKYEFGDQGTVLVAVDDERPTNEIKYSLDHGVNWESHKFSDDVKIRAGFLTTIPDSTLLKFLLMGSHRNGNEMQWSLFTLDFTGIYDNKCKDDDFEDWTAKNEDGTELCVMGHTQTYRRRKKTAKCYVGEKFNEVKPTSKPCTCTHNDYECDYNYIPEGTGESRTCEPSASLKKSLSSCKDGAKTFKDRSGFRLIPGNKCKDGVKKDQEEVDRPCDVTEQPAIPDGQVGTKVTTFPGAMFVQKVYLERNDLATGTDETVVMSVAQESGAVRIYVSRDHGKTWAPKFREDENYQLIVKHQYEYDRVFFVAPNSVNVSYSLDRLENMKWFEAPSMMNTQGISPLVFHQGFPDNLIWTGRENCDRADIDCHADAHISNNRGNKWDILVRYARKCEFIERTGRGTEEELIYCEQREAEQATGKWQLQASTNLGRSFTPKATDIIAFATMSEFIIVAEKDPKTNLKLATSVDGQIFADAKFPHDFYVVQSAYTVLDSSTHSVFLHVTTSNIPHFEFGRIVKSNSNGTVYVTSLDNVNRDASGFVDFEKMHGVDGVAMVNVVANPEDASSGKAKKLRSLISHNDGSMWAPIKAPADNPEGDAWVCDTSNVEKCSLHLHSYTERDDAKHTFSSASAIGLMVAVGNVGEYLSDINDKDNTYTFISSDAGINWSVAKKGRYLWEYGDQGSLIVLVEQATTNIGYYTLDEGKSWTRFNFNTEGKVFVLDLTTAPLDNSKQFLVWFRGADGKVGTVNLDFSAAKSTRICTIDDEHNHENDDYLLWKPKHPLQDNDCLFGQEMQYLRKKPDADCWNGPKIERLHGTPTPCACTRQDFECDYNFARTVDDRCELVSGATPTDPAAVCRADPNLKTFYKEGLGYRKLPISKCVEGETKKFMGDPTPCPGHENDADLPSERKGLSGFAFFLVAIVLPITAAAGIGYLVWSRIQSGAGFGRIRLGDMPSSSSAFDTDQPWVRYPVALLSGLVAVVTAVPLLIGAGWRALTSRFGSGRRYTSRQSFARGRGDYSIVEDEDELLGDDEEET